MKRYIVDSLWGAEIEEAFWRSWDHHRENFHHQTKRVVQKQNRDKFQKHIWGIVRLCNRGFECSGVVWKLFSSIFLLFGFQVPEEKLEVGFISTVAKLVAKFPLG